MNKNDNLNDISDKPPLKINNKDFNNIDFYNFQNYYNLIKKLKNQNINISSDFIENLYNISNSYKKQKVPPLSIKLLNDIKQISHHIYKDKNSNNPNNTINNKEHKKKFIDKYNIIINSVKTISPSPTIKSNKNKNKNKNRYYPLKNNYPIKVYLSKEKDKNNKDRQTININDINEDLYLKKEKIRNNTVDSIINNKNNSKRIKYEYGNYALNTTNFNHPQFYILNNNNNDNAKEKLPLIGTSNGFKFRKSGDLSYLIPYNNKKLNVRKNFYNYYIGMKLSKNNFNI